MTDLFKKLLENSEFRIADQLVRDLLLVEDSTAAFLRWFHESAELFNCNVRRDLSVSQRCVYTLDHRYIGSSGEVQTIFSKGNL